MRWLSPPDNVPEARGERQIIEPDVDQELEPLADFLEHAHADFVLLGGQVLRQVGEPFAGALDRQFGDLGDVLAGDLDAQRLGLEPGAVAGGAGHVGEIFLQVLARPFRFGFLEAAFRFVITPSNGFLVV